MKITITLKPDRWALGVLSLDGTDFSCVCLGRADQAAATKMGNPTRNPLKRNGDTPTGLYRAIVGERLSNTRSYGPQRVIRIDPTGGDALAAKQAGRAGLLIHGGDVGVDGRSLRPTHGCVRLKNFYMAGLLVYLDASGEVEHEVIIREVPANA